MSCYNRCKVNRYPKDFRNIKDTPASFKTEAALEQEKKFQELLEQRNQVAKPVEMKEPTFNPNKKLESVPSHMTPWKTPSIS
jgi:hypothetical protein